MNKQSNKSEKASTHRSSLNFKQFLKPLVAGVFLLTLVVGLIHFSTPSADMIPYDQFKKTAAAQDSPETSAEKGQNIDEPPAIKDLVKQIADTPAPPQPLLPKATLQHLAQAMKLVEAGEVNAADMEFEKAAAISPDSPEVYSIWATTLKVIKKFGGANKQFAKAHELAPNDHEITLNWGISQLQGGKIDSALDLFKKTLELNPDDYMAYNMLGKAYGRKKKYRLEAENYTKALAIKPNFARAHFNLGIVLSLLKDVSRAIPHFKTAIKLDKEFEKPFVMKFLARFDEFKDATQTAKQEETKKEKGEPPLIITRLDSPGEAGRSESEGSGHNMPEGSSGSKVEKETTNVSGKILVNGEKIPVNAVVILETKDKLPVPGQKVQTLTIAQKNLQFVPQHSVVLVGSTLTFVNEDKEPHNIFSKSLDNQFNLGAMAAGASKSIKVVDPGPIVLRCNLHKEMIGTVFVIPNGYFTQPTETGEYFFSNVKSKEYFMHVWHPRLIPEEVAKFSKSIGLIGKDKVYDFNIQTASLEGEIHDLVDATDYDAIVDSIESLIFLGIEDWKRGKKYIPRKRILIAITRHYAGEGLKGAIAKSFDVERSMLLENKLDDIRKKVSGIKTDGAAFTEESLKQDAKLVISQLRDNVRELKARLGLNP